MIARWIIIAGLVLLVIGLILRFAPWLVNWFGKLPGDIRIEGKRSKVFIPITSMLVVSLILTVVINLIRWLANLFS